MTNNQRFPWAQLEEVAFDIGVHYLKILGSMAAGERFYVVGFDCIEDCTEIVVAANTEECLAATGGRVFPLRPIEVSKMVLRWSLVQWGYYDIESKCGDKYGVTRTNEFSERWWELDQEQRSGKFEEGLEMAGDRFLKFRTCMVSALLRLREAPEFSALQKTDDFQLVYWEHGNRPFQSEAEMVQWLKDNPLSNELA